MQRILRRNTSSSGTVMTRLLPQIKLKKHPSWNLFMKLSRSLSWLGAASPFKMSLTQPQHAFVQVIFIWFLNQAIRLPRPAMTVTMNISLSLLAREPLRSSQSWPLSVHGSIVAPPCFADRKCKHVPFLQYFAGLHWMISRNG